MKEVDMGKIQDYDYFIQFLRKTNSSRQRKCLLKYATRGQILALAEIVANYLAGNIGLKTSVNFSVYVRHKRLFRVLGHKGRRSWLKRKQAAVTLGRVLVKFLLDVTDKVI